MPARPPTISLNSSRSGHDMPQARAGFRAGALWRTPSGAKFRISKDAQRIHAATDSRRNVVLLKLATAGQVPPDLSSWLRELVSNYGASPTWASAHRTWRVSCDAEGLTAIGLEVHGGTRAKVRFPVRGMSPFIEPHNHEALRRTAEELWSSSLAYEQDLAARR